jgi:hypothetical protein
MATPEEFLGAIFRKLQGMSRLDIPGPFASLKGKMELDNWNKPKLIESLSQLGKLPSPNYLGSGVQNIVYEGPGNTVIKIGAQEPEANLEGIIPPLSLQPVTDQVQVGLYPRVETETPRTTDISYQIGKLDPIRNKSLITRSYWPVDLHSENIGYSPDMGFMSLDSGAGLRPRYSSYNDLNYPRQGLLAGSNILGQYADSGFPSIIQSQREALLRRLQALGADPFPSESSGITS